MLLQILTNIKNFASVLNPVTCEDNNWKNMYCNMSLGNQNTAGFTVHNQYLLTDTKHSFIMLTFFLKLLFILILCY